MLPLLSTPSWFILLNQIKNKQTYFIIISLIICMAALMTGEAFVMEKENIAFQDVISNFSTEKLKEI